MKKSSFLKLILISIAILLIDGSLLAGLKIQNYFPKNKSFKSINNSTFSLNQKDVTSSFDLTKIDTSNWNTYRSERYSFEVGYPKEWVVDDKTYATIEIFKPPRDPSGDKIIGIDVYKVLWSSVGLANVLFPKIKSESKIGLLKKYYIQLIEFNGNEIKKIDEIPVAFQFINDKGIVIDVQNGVGMSRGMVDSSIFKNVLDSIKNIGFGG